MPPKSYESPQRPAEKTGVGSIGQSPTNTRWLIFLLACFASFLTYAHRYSWGVARAKLSEEGIMSAKELGWLDGAFYITYGNGQFPGGLAGDFFGPRLVIPVAALLWSVTMAGPAMTTGFWRLYASRLLFGATQAPCYPSLGKISKSWFPLSIRTSLQGMVASFSGRLGGAVAPFILGTILMGACGLNWQISLYVLASSGLVFALLFWLMFRDSPTHHPWSNVAEKRLIERDEKPATKGKFRIHWTRPAMLNLGCLMSASFFSTFADNLFVIYMPTFLMGEKGFTVAQMGMFAPLPIIGGAIGGMCGGFLNDAMIRVIGNRRVARSLVAATGKSLAAGLIVASLFVEDGRLVMIVLFCCKFFSDMSQPTWWGTVTDIGGRAAGSVFGLVNTVGGWGAIVAGPAMGYVLGDFGWTVLFLFVGGIYLVTAIFWCFVNCTRKVVAE